MMKKTVSRRSTNLEKKYHQPTPSTRRAPGSWRSQESLLGSGEWQWQCITQCLGVVHRLAVPVVLPVQVECPTLLEHPEAEESLHKVDMSRYSVDIQ